MGVVIMSDIEITEEEIEEEKKKEPETQEEVLKKVSFNLSKATIEPSDEEEILKEVSIPEPEIFIKITGAKEVLDMISVETVIGKGNDAEPMNIVFPKAEVTDAGGVVDRKLILMKIKKQYLLIKANENKLEPKELPDLLGEEKV